MSFTSVYFEVLMFYLHCALAAVQCIVISPVCGRVCVWEGLLPQKFEKLHALILTKLGL